MKSELIQIKYKIKKILNSEITKKIILLIEALGLTIILYFGIKGAILEEERQKKNPYSDYKVIDETTNYKILRGKNGQLYYLNEDNELVIMTDVNGKPIKVKIKRRKHKDKTGG